MQIFTKAKPDEVIEYPALIEEIINRHCPETGDEQVVHDVYEKPVQVLYKYLGACPATPGNQGDIPTRFEWQMRLTGEAMRVIETLPLQKYKNLTGDHKWHWHRAVWNRALYWGLGDLIKQCRIYQGDEAIDLLRGAVPDNEEGAAIKLVLRSERDKEIEHVHMMALEMAVVQQIGMQGAIDNGLDRDVWLHSQNSYWQFDSQTNPIVHILKLAVPRARRLFATECPYNIITPDLTTMSQQPVRHVDRSFLPGKQKPEQQKKKETKVTASLSAEVISMPKPTVVAGYPGKEAFSINLSKWIERKELPINCKGAILHVTPDNHLGVTYPKGIEQLALLNQLPTEEFMSELEKKQLLVNTGQRYFFDLPKTKKTNKHLPISLVLLDKKAMSATVQHIEPNPIIIHRPKD